MNSLKSKNTEIVKQTALKLNFDLCGISKAEFLEEEAPRLEKWLNSGHQAGMSYMNNYFDKRLNPKLLLEGAKSVISVLYNYYPQEEMKNSYKIAKYAYGRDYHKVLKKKLKLFVQELQAAIGDFNGRCFVDSAPVMEKAWAKKSGLGWVGKNSLLINPKKGSFFFLAQIISDLDLNYDQPIKDFCGSCNKCVEACPTKAIVNDKVIDSNKCISFQNIELKDEIINPKLKGLFNDWLFGCDICQDVCPWNRFSSSHKEPEFNPKEALLKVSNNDLKHLSEIRFEELFVGSAVKRAKYKGLKRTLNFLAKND